ncbi:hypothetical protein ABT297_32885 [Dactylosporangium sp. NPDC000555]|uniref:hypothetical protein n=1 Tax=Dactylosporangium sp. NPDC000555 TaxID=3154260 RepID=UPI00331AAE2E
MIALLVLLLLVWLAFIILGAAVKGLLWLLVIGVILFVATSVFGFIKRETLGRRH